MAISFVGAIAVQGSGSGAVLPTHIAGDLIIAIACRMYSDNPILNQAGWTRVSESYGETSGMAVSTIVATGPGTVGTFTNAEDVIFAVYRGATSAINFQHRSDQNISPGVLFREVDSIADNLSWVGHVIDMRNSTNSVETHIPGSDVLRVNAVVRPGEGTAAQVAYFDTNAPVASFPYGQFNEGIYSGPSSRYRTLSFEITAGPISGGITHTALSDVSDIQGFTERDATYSVTLASDSVSATAYTAPYGTFIHTALSDTTVINAVTDREGAITITLNSDSVIATGDAGLFANYAAVLASDGVSASAYTAPYGNFAHIALSDTSIISGVGDIDATYTVTLASDSANASAFSDVLASISITLASDSVIAVGDAGMFGNFASTALSDTAVIEGIGDITATASIVLVSDAVAATGDVGAIGDITTFAKSDVAEIAGISDIVADTTIVLASDNVIATAFTDISVEFIHEALSDTSTIFATSDTFAGITVTLASDGVEASGEAGHFATFSPVAKSDVSAIAGFTSVQAEASIFLNSDNLLAIADVNEMGRITIVLNSDSVTAAAGPANESHFEHLAKSDLATIVGDFGVYSDFNHVAKSDSTFIHALADDYDDDDLKPGECCIPPLCEIDPCMLICNFVNLLPTGPLWDEDKKKVLDRFQTPNPLCIDDVRQVNCLYDPTMCTSIVRHSVYTALRLYDVLLNALWPAIRESDPVTAYDTMDDWLTRLGWVNCFESTCRDADLGSLTPFELGNECGAEYCEPTYPKCLLEATKHGILLALTRLKMQPVPNLANINRVIEPLGAVIRVVPGTEAICPLQYTIGPTKDVVNEWSRDNCIPNINTCSAYYEPNACYQTGLPQRIYPGVIAAECIARSMLLKCGLVEFTRLCEVA